MITELTKEQKAKMPEWVEKWIKIGLCTDEADWDNFEKGVRECYKFAGLKPVPIIRVQSPIVGALASSVARMIIERKLKIGSEAYSAVGSEAYSVVDSAVGYAVRSAVGYAVGSEVGSEAYFVVGSEAYFAVRSEVDYAVGYAVYSAVGSEVYSEAYSAVGYAVRSAVGSAVDSVVGYAVDLRQLKWHWWMGGQFWVDWQAFVTFFTDVCNWKPEGDILQKIRAYELAQKSACYWWPNKYFVMVCNRPSYIKRNQKGQLHCENDKAIKWRDGWGIYCLNGVRVTEEIVMTPADKLSPELALKEKNAEVRNQIVKKIGIERLYRELNVKTIDTYKIGTNPDVFFDVYELVNLGQDKYWPYLKMTNASSGIFHLEGVSPECKTAQDAFNWRYKNKFTNHKIVGIS